MVLHDRLGLGPVAVGELGTNDFHAGCSRMRRADEKASLQHIDTRQDAQHQHHSDDVLLTGGYPDGRDRGNIQEALLSKEDFLAANRRIMMLPIPGADPATGRPIKEWLDAPSSVDAGWNDYRDGLDAR